LKSGRANHSNINPNSTMNNLLTIAELIQKLKEIAVTHGDRLPVVGVSDIELTEILMPTSSGPNSSNVIPAIRLVRN
jgi:hypothetical protein